MKATAQPHVHSVSRILADELARAPARRRREVAWMALGFAGVIAFVVWDYLSGSDGMEPYRLAAVTLAVLGMALLSLAQILLAAPRSREVDAPIPDRTRFALPMVILAASLLLAAAAGVMVPASSGNALFVLVALAMAVFAARAAFGVHDAHRLLFLDAVAHAERAGAANAEATAAQLAALQSQTNPHFLFNALNTIAALVRTDARAAERTVENLGDVLRRTLDRSSSPTTTLRDELEFLEAYLDVERERWGERLRVVWDVSPQTAELRVPTLVLQPLVENALKHGLARTEGGTVRIAANVVDDRLLLVVGDDGVGMPARSREGTGLGNLRRRLETLYGDAATLSLVRAVQGAEARVELPLRPEPGT